MDLHGIDTESAIQQLKDLMREHGMKVIVTLVVSLASSVWGWIWGRRKWRSRQDMGVIHYSQNTIEGRPTGPDGTNENWLILDVWAEDQLKDEVSHPVPRRLIRQAAGRTTVDQPFLLFPEKDRWYVLNIIRLAIAEQYRTGAAAKMARQATVETVECMFALTFERYPNMKQGKIRVMIAPKSLFDDECAIHTGLRTESASHKERITTLQKMREDYLAGKEAGNWQYCLDVRINVQIH